MCVILKCLIFEFSPFEKHGAIWHLIGNRNTQKFICTSHAINQSLRSWNLLCLCHYSLTLFFLFQILILLVNFAKSWLRRLFGMPGKSWTKKKLRFFTRGIFMMNEIRRVAFFPDFIKTSLKFSIFGVINTIFHIFNDFLRLLENILFLCSSICTLGIFLGYQLLL